MAGNAESERAIRDIVEALVVAWNREFQDVDRIARDDVLKDRPRLHIARRIFSGG